MGRITCRMAVLGAALLAAPDVAQGCPVRVVVGFPPGGAADIVARRLADRPG